MKEIPKKEDQRKLATRYRISEDELCHRMFLQSKYHDAPLASVTALIEEALDNIMKKLGVDITQEPDIIKQQQADLGITIWTEEREEMAGLQGFFIHTGGDRFIPHAWIGAPYIGGDGLSYIDIHDLKNEVLIKFGGVKIPLEGMQG